MKEEGKLRRDRGCKVDKAEISGGSRQDLRGQPHMGFMELHGITQCRERPDPSQRRCKGREEGKSSSS